MISSPISCIANIDALKTEFVNNYCYNHGTFTVPGLTREFAGLGKDLDTKYFHDYYLHKGPNSPKLSTDLV